MIATKLAIECSKDQSFLITQKIKSVLVN